MDLIVPGNVETFEKLTVGQIFSAYNAPFQMQDDNDVFSKLLYVVYLGKYQEIPEHSFFLVVLRNNNIIIRILLNSNIIQYLNKGWFIKTNRKLIPNDLLQDIRLYTEKPIVDLVGEKTKVKLPNNIKNQILGFFGHSENVDYFPVQESGMRKYIKGSYKTKKNLKRKNKKLRTYRYRKYRTYRKFLKNM